MIAATRAGIDGSDILNSFSHSIHDLGADLVVAQLARTITDRDLDLVAFIQKLDRLLGLDPEVVGIDIGPQLQLFHFQARGLLALLFTDALLLIHMMSIIHDPANWRIPFRCHLDQVQRLALGTFEGGLEGNNPQLLSFAIDEPDFRRINLFIGSDVASDETNLPSFNAIYAT